MIGRPNVRAQHGMVATPHYLASQVAVRVLQDGGNAVDAAIAANATLNVVLTQQCHIGGDLFALVWDPTDGNLSGLNASGPAPEAASIGDMRAQGHAAMPQRGALSVTVPGTVGGWAALNKRFGSRELGRLFEPAIDYARNGFPVSAKLAMAIEDHRWLLKSNAVATSTFLHRSSWKAGMILRQPMLAATFEAVGRDGPDAFYTGSIADDIVRTLQAGGSRMEHTDLRSYQPEWVQPLRAPYRGCELVEMPPNSQGPAALLLAGIASGWDNLQAGQTSADTIHRSVEAVRRAFIERDRYLTDPRRFDVPLERFTDPQYVTQHRDAILMDRTGVAAVAPAEDGDTVYLCIVDRDGMAVSLIQSVYLGFGSGVMTPESGILFQNRGYSFSLDASHANALAGGKRPRHTLIPAMLLRDDKPEIVFGAMGGDGQAQTHLQLLLGLIDFGLDPQEAIEVPRWLATTGDDGAPKLVVEPDLGADVIGALQQRGHQVEIGASWDQRMGHAQIIAIDRTSGVLAGGADPRGDGMAAGW